MSERDHRLRLYGLVEGIKKRAVEAAPLVEGCSYGPFEAPRKTVGCTPWLASASTAPNVLSIDTPQ